MVKRIGLLALILLCLLNAGCNWDIFEMNVPETAILYDVEGREIKSLVHSNRIQVGLGEISYGVQKAFIAGEDKNFYKHHGIDLRAIGRALLTNISEGHIVQGGSTITQQTAKTLFLTRERTLWRKIKELFYTFYLEAKYSKDEILALYLNSIYFGEGATGIEAAARTYFGKSASELTLAESTILAAIPRRPSYYDPYIYPDHAKHRQEYLLKLMVKEGYITQEQADVAYKEKLIYKKARYLSGNAPYFAEMVMDYLVDKYGTEIAFGGGLKVYTTLDLDMQKAAQDAYDSVMKNRNKNLQATLVAQDVKTGEVRAMIGGRDYVTAPFNRAVDSKRQPGSAFKPFMYSLALNRGFTQAYTINCEPVTFYIDGSSDYTPTDYGDEPYHYRAFTLKEAIAKSDNVVSVRLNELLGPQNTAKYARNFGFKGTIRPVLSLALGTSEVSPLEMCNAYCAFANGGYLPEPVTILKVVDRKGRVLERNSHRLKQILTPENAYLITDMLKSVLQSGGTGSHLGSILQRHAAGKTGTTQNYRDAWFVGYTPELSCAVWVGYDKQTRSVGLPGGSIAGPIWANFVKQALKELPDADFPKPENIKKLWICMDSGQVATEYCPRTIEAAFINGSEPSDLCYWHQPFNKWWKWDDDNDDQKYWDRFLQRAHGLRKRWLELLAN